MDKFISEIMEEVSSNYAADEKNAQARIDKRKEIQNKIEEAKRETVNVLKSKILETKTYLSDMLSADKDMDENAVKDGVEERLAYCLNEVSMHIGKSFSQIEESVFDVPNIENHVSLKTKTENRKRGFGLVEKLQNTGVFNKSGDMLGTGIERISELAKPVVTGKKRHLFKKNENIMSEIGGSGTQLHGILTKMFPKYGAQMSVKLGKLSGRMAGVAKFSAIVGEGIDVAISIGNSVKEQYDENKRHQRRSMFQWELNREISEIEKLIKKEIEDQFEELSKRVDENYIDTDSPNGKLLSVLREKRMELRKLTDDFNEVGNESKI